MEKITGSKVEKRRLLISLAVAIVLGMSYASVAWAEKGALKVKEEVVIYEVCDEVWPIIRNFGAMDQWHPAVVRTMLNGGNTPGATRVLVLGNGAEVHEELTKYSSKAMSMSYIITRVDPKVLPVKNYQSRLRLEKEGSRCEVDWSGTFDNASSGSMSDDDVKEAIEGVYKAGLESIAKMMMMK